MYILKRKYEKHYNEKKTRSIEENEKVRKQESQKNFVPTFLLRELQGVLYYHQQNITIRHLRTVIRSPSGENFQIRLQDERLSWACRATVGFLRSMRSQASLQI
jgi:hypothetical protein